MEPVKGCGKGGVIIFGLCQSCKQDPEIGGRIKQKADPEDFSKLALKELDRISIAEKEDQ